MNYSVITPEFDESGRPLRQIRSFVRRQGRLTKGQQQALTTLWPRWGLDFQPAPLTLATLFTREAPVVMEIGFGMGDSLVAMAKQHPQYNFLGVEVHLPGVGACLSALAAADIHNLRVVCHDAIEVLQQMISDNSLSRVQLYFPDPWHKARHHKRRIVQEHFVSLVARKLKLGGQLHIATDWQPYAEAIVQVIAQVDALRNCSTTGDYVEKPAFRPQTKFERRGERLGHGVWDLLFEKVAEF